MRVLRNLFAGVLLVAVAGTPSGCALLHKPTSPTTDANITAGCDRPFEELLALMGACGDLNPPLAGRRIPLSECVAAALKNGRAGDNSFRVRTYEAARTLAEVKAGDLPAAGKRLATERVWQEIDLATQDVLLAVETAYWGLVQARATLASREEAVRSLDEEAATVKARYEEKLLARQDVDTLTEQRHLARVELIAARAALREAERNLRRQAGLAPDDGCGLVPCTEPERAPPICDNVADLEAARQHLPELCGARIAVEIALQEYKAVTDAKARPAARLRIDREEANLRNVEEEMIFALQRVQRQVTQAWQSLTELTAREEAARRRLEAVTEKWQSKEFGELRELLQARSGLATAQGETLRGVTEYQNARAELLRRKGLLLQHHHVGIARPTPRLAPGD